MPLISLVVVNYNGRHLLGACLDSIRGQTFTDHETILVDNGSQDGSVAWVKERYPWVKVISLGSNRGFAGGANEGLKMAQGDYIALLNNDVELAPDWLERLYSQLQKDPSYAFCTGKTYKLSNRHPCQQVKIIDGVGDSYLRLGFFYRIGHGEPDRGQYNQPAEIFGASAGVALYRRGLFERIGLFDEDFFMYLEDGDLNFRAQLQGLRCLYVPGAIAYHHGSATAGGKGEGGLSGFIVRYTTRNQIMLLLKDVPLYILIRSFIFILLGQVYWFYKAVLRYHLWRPYFHGLREALLTVSLNLKKRRIIMRERKISSSRLYQKIRSWERWIILQRLRHRAALSWWRRRESNPRPEAFG